MSIDRVQELEAQLADLEKQGASQNSAQGKPSIEEINRIRRERYGLPPIEERDQELAPESYALRETNRIRRERYGLPPLEETNAWRHEHGLPPMEPVTTLAGC